MNTKKKILSLFLAVMMVVSAFSAIAVSANTAECSYTVDGGTATSGKLSDAIAACTAGTKVVVTLNSCTLESSATYTVAGDLTINGGAMQNVAFKQNTSSKITLNDVTMTKNSGSTEPFLATTRATSSGAAEYFTANNCTFNTVGDSASWAQFMISRYSYVTFNSCTINADGKVSNAAINNEATALNGTENMGACFTYWNANNGQIGYLYLNDVTINTPNDTYGFVNTKYFDGSLSSTRGARIYMNDVQYDAAGTDKDFDTNDFMMLSGASIRKTVSETAPCGLRFTMDISKLSDAEAYGMLFARYNDIKDIVAFTSENSTNENGDTIIKTITATGDGCDGDKYNMILVGNESADIRETQFAARGYAYWSLGSSARIYVYSSFNTTDNVRSMTDVANAIKAERATDTTKYTQVEYDAIIAAYLDE